MVMSTEKEAFLNWDQLLGEQIHLRVPPWQRGEKDKKVRLLSLKMYLQSNLNGSNTFGTMKISSRQG